jgi:hypothetical protein
MTSKLGMDTVSHSLTGITMPVDFKLHHYPDIGRRLDLFRVFQIISTEFIALARNWNPILSP